MVLGILLLIRAIWRVLQDSLSYVVAPLFGWQIDLRKYGKWAVVTGGSDGIGKGYVLALLKRRLNVLIVSRNPEKLEIVAKELRQKCPEGVQVETLYHDFAVRDYEKDKIKFEKAFEKLDIGILINNVGVCQAAGGGITANFSADGEDPTRKGLESLDVNVASTVLMTGLLLPKFVQREAKGVIVNISSLVATCPIKGVAVYCASKAFINFFTDSLRLETKGTGVIVQTVTPSLTKTKLAPPISHFFPNFVSADPIQYAESALSTVGIANRTSGCLAHELHAYVLQGLAALLPPTIVEFTLSNGVSLLSWLQQLYEGKRKAV